ncbi:MAG: polyhydroxybutyrate depolymerase [Rhizobiaceae bacterium]|nr:polyhydroxybutyrate depolymerase [Rhizobiaceae bacterium]
MKQKLRISSLLSIATVVAFTFLGTGSPPIISAQATECIGNVPCSIGDRSYHVLPPDDWDGVTPLPILVHFHGWGRQGPVPINHKHIGQETRKRNVLLVAPNGLGKSWDFWRPGSRDTGFTKLVLDDVAKRYPIDRSKLFVSGYSWGSSMAWRFSCEAGDQVSVLLGISGTFYDQSENCETGPVEVRHVHGLKDTVMDFPFGPNGEETGPVRLWQRVNECSSKPDQTSSWETSQKYTHYAWTQCSSGKNVQLDVHGGGHWIARGWLAKQLDELLAKTTNS